MSQLIIVQGIVVALAFVIYRLFFRKKQTLLPVPPGPKPLPILGNINDLPPPGVPEYEHWLPFKDKYGPVSSVNVLGQTMVILHDSDAVMELLEKTSMKTSARAYLFFATEMCGFGDFLPAMPYDDEFRQHRKYIHQQLGTLALAARFSDVQDVESKRLLLRVLNDPENFMEHIKAEASAIILKITYGYAIEPHNPDPLVKLVEDFMLNLSAAFIPMSWPVDIIPALRHLPDWFPGTGFKQTARKWRAVNEAVVGTPYEFVRKQMELGIHQEESYVSGLIRACGNEDGSGVSPEDMKIIQYTATSMYGGGADTTVSTIMAFTIAMIMFPDVQRKAQEEIDRVVGTDRLPGYEDRDNLPYTDAIAKEALRYFPVVPVGTPHKTEEELVFRGYRIPKNTYILPSIWWFLHDPKVYHDPETFDPARYLEPRNEPDPFADAFGYGRRVCPGRYLATESLYLTIARLLAAFTIEKAVDKNGKPIDVEFKHTPGLVSHPQKFAYSIKPRTEKHASLIRQVERDHPWQESDAVHLEGELIEEYKANCKVQAKK